MPWLNQLHRIIYITDLLDILIMALFVYSLFLFLKRSRNYSVFLGLTMAFGLYIIARELNLYLTFLTLRYFAGISVLVIVIIFQTEIRKYFELLGIIGTRQIKVPGRLIPRSPTTIEIIHASAKLARTKMGALIVLQGQNNLDRYIEGGIPLDGTISEEIILSIFDPHSQGHDGAMIVNNNRIVTFGAHLPLSTNFRELGKTGTRHAAALGIAEIADALCIVVSEERGVISICRDEKMKTLNNIADLEKELEKFIKQKFQTKTEHWFTKIFKHNFWFKAGAFLMTALIWFFTAYKTEVVEHKFTVTVDFSKQPEETVIESYSPKEINVTLKGRGERSFNEVNADTLKLMIEAGEVTAGINKIELNNEDFSIPLGTTLVSFEPNTILLTAKNYKSVEVPIIIRIKGETKPRIEIDSTLVTPDKLLVQVEEGRSAPAQIFTETIDASNIQESIIIPTKLVIPNDIRVPEGNSEVSVAINVKGK